MVYVIQTHYSARKVLKLTLPGHYGIMVVWYKDMAIHVLKLTLPGHYGIIKSMEGVLATLF